MFQVTFWPKGQTPFSYNYPNLALAEAKVARFKTLGILAWIENRRIPR